MIGKRTLITGVSSGFGIDFAHELAAMGHHLVLVARCIEPMQALADELAARHSIKTQVIGMDLAQAGVGEMLKAQLDVEGIAIDVLINNAGNGVFGEFNGQSLEKTLNMLLLNIIALTELTYAFSQNMVRRGSAGKILLVSLIGGYQETPIYAAYSASKANALLFGEALHEELRASGITVTVLSPDVTATGFLQVSGQQATLYQRLLMMQSRQVVKIGLAALNRGRASIIPGRMNAILAWSNRFASRFMQCKVAH